MREPVYYKDREIEPMCRELADQAGWTVACNIITHRGDRTDVQGYDSEIVEPSLEEAQKAAIQLGMSAIDRSR